MKTTYRIISVFVASLCLLNSCTSSLDEELTPSSPSTLTLSVSVGNYTPTGSGAQTRAAGAYPFTFRNGDRVGVTAIDVSNNIATNCNNIPFTYKDGKWTPVAPVPFSSAYKYLVYYPYQEGMKDKTTKDAIITSFAPLADQRSEADYRASDLLVCDPITPAITDKTLNVTFQHAFSLLVIPAVKATITSEGIKYTCGLPATDVSITAGTEVGLSYMASDGTARLVVKPQTASLKSYLNYAGKLYSSSAGDVTLFANRYYAFKELATTFTYGFKQTQVGDYYCRAADGSGYLIPSEAASFPDDMNCIGIIFKVGRDDNGNWKDDCTYYQKDGSTPMTTIHGYVLGLYDAKDGSGNTTFTWGPYDTEVGTNQERDTGFYGYKNTNAIKAFATQKGWTLQSAFPATYYATVGYEASCPAPANSSGWFLPSGGQGRYWLDNRDALLPSVKKATGDNSYNWQSYYWSSSEGDHRPANNAWSVGFYNGYVNNVGKSLGYNVRSIFAF